MPGGRGRRPLSNAARPAPSSYLTPVPAHCRRVPRGRQRPGQPGRRLPSLLVQPGQALAGHVPPAAVDGQRVSAATGAKPADVEQGAASQMLTGRFTRPDEMADLVLFLASVRAGNITGADFAIGGGLISTR